MVPARLIARFSAIASPLERRIAERVSGQIWDFPAIQMRAQYLLSHRLRSVLPALLVRMVSPGFTASSAPKIAAREHQCRMMLAR